MSDSFPERLHWKYTTQHKMLNLVNLNPAGQKLEIFVSFGVTAVLMLQSISITLERHLLQAASIKTGIKPAVDP